MSHLVAFNRKIGDTNVTLVYIPHAEMWILDRVSSKTWHTEHFTELTSAVFAQFLSIK